eukprot:6576172-Prymnesium_polylepis.1
MRWMWRLSLTRSYRRAPPWDRGIELNGEVAATARPGKYGCSSFGGVGKKLKITTSASGAKGGRAHWARDHDDD